MSATKRFLLLPGALALLLGPAAAGGKMQTEEIEYQVNGETFTGYLAYDDAADSGQPGIIVVHEWWGHSEFARAQAEKLAQEGYTAFALDMYGSGQQADHPDDAASLAAEATRDVEQVKARFEAALDLLREHESVDPDRLAAQGYCFGGSIVLNMARAGADLKGVVSFHGSLDAHVTAEPGAVKSRLLVFTGGADPMVPPEQVAEFVKEMQEAQADFTLVSFPNAKHSFTNPAADRYAEEFGMPVGYDAGAAERAWDETLAFYKRIFAE